MAVGWNSAPSVRFRCRGRVRSVSARTTCVEPRFRDFRAGDVRHSLADIGHARALLGYAPTHRLDDGLAAAIGWYVDYLAKR